MPIATLILEPTLSRSTAESTTLVIAGHTEVRLELTLETRGYDRYQAVIRTPEGEAVWQSPPLPRRRNGARESIVLRFPADRLRAQDYIVSLSGVAAGAAPEEVAAYYFRVVRR